MRRSINKHYKFLLESGYCPKLDTYDGSKKKALYTVMLCRLMDDGSYDLIPNVTGVYHRTKIHKSITPMSFKYAEIDSVEDKIMLRLIRSVPFLLASLEAQAIDEVLANHQQTHAKRSGGRL